MAEAEAAAVVAVASVADRVPVASVAEETTEDSVAPDPAEDRTGRADSDHLTVRHTEGAFSGAVPVAIGDRDIMAPAAVGAADS